MRAMIGLSAAFWLLLLLTGFAVTRADAHEVATRCDAYSCSTIVCNRTGDRCRRYDEEQRNDWRRRNSDRDEVGYGRSGESRWRSNCDPDNPTCVVRAGRYDHHYDE